MKKEYLYGMVGLLGGALIVLIFANNAVNSNNSSMMKMMGMHSNNQAANEKRVGENEHIMPDGSMMNNTNMDGDMTMNGMVNSLKGKTGDEFDKTFLSEMIPHHQGAIDMAELAIKNAGHQEIKDLAQDIIKAQEAEIKMMQDWQTNWGY